MAVCVGINLLNLLTFLSYLGVLAADKNINLGIFNAEVICLNPAGGTILHFPFLTGLG